MRILLSGLLVVIAAGFAYQFFGAEKTAGRRASPVVTVSSYTAERRDFADRVEALGTLRGNESVTLSANASDTISEIHFSEGQRVEAGQLLVTLEMREELAQLAGARADSLNGKKLGGLFDSASRDRLTTQLGAALGSDAAAPIPVKLSKGGRQANVDATGFSQSRRQYLLLIVTPADEARAADDHSLSDIVETMPDAFVIADGDMRIVRANATFVELVDAASEEQLCGRALARLIGRPGIDLDLIASQMEKDGVARNVTSVVRNISGSAEEPVEISAVATGDDTRHYGFVIRPVGRRLREIASSGDDLPRSVDELTDRARELGLEGYSKLNKEELIDALRSH